MIFDTQNLTPDPRFAAQLHFLLEVDRLKQIVRRTYIIGGSRRENSAEHSWQLALMAVVLAEHADPSVDILRVIKMMLVHDIVEIDAGDTFIYAIEGNTEGSAKTAQSKLAQESMAADRIFGLLPAEQGAELRALWQEYEDQVTPESHFAQALDRVMPLLHNFYHGEGGSWRDHGIRAGQVRGLMEKIRTGPPIIYQLAQTIIERAVDLNMLVE